MAKRKRNAKEDMDLGGLGNTGQFSRAAYNRGGLGAGYDAAGRASRERGDAEAALEAAGEYGGPESGAELDSEEARDASPGSDTSDASWSRRGYGPYGYAGGFAGRDYDWTTRGERAEQEQDSNSENDT